MKKYENHVGVIIMDGFGSSVDVGSDDRLHHMVKAMCTDIHQKYGYQYVWRYHRWAFFRAFSVPWMRRRIRRLHKKGVRYWAVFGFSFGAYRLITDVIPRMREEKIFRGNTQGIFIDPQNTLTNQNDNDLIVDFNSGRNYYQVGKMGGYKVDGMSNHKIDDETHSSIRHSWPVQLAIESVLVDMGAEARCID